MKNVIIIGAGFGGLSAACLLAKNGYSVKVIEKNASPGGRAMVFRTKGFVFDMGPSWYLMPDVFEKFFSYFDKKPSNFYQLIRLDPSYKIFFEKNDVLDIHSELAKNVLLFDSLEREGGRKFKKYLALSKNQYKTIMDHFMYRDYTSVKDLMHYKLLTHGSKMRLLDNLDSYTRRFFTSDKARKILEYSMVFLGGAPKNTPSLYSIMSHIDFNLGVWYPQGGMGSVVSALTSLGKSLGVTYLYDEPVKKIDCTDTIATHISTTKRTYKTDIVVANADYHHVETSLLPKHYQTYSSSYWRKKTIAPSAFILYLGLNKKLRNVAHHNLFLEQNWMNHFDEIFERPVWPKHPSYYVCVPSVTDKTIAPRGHENVFILVPIAPGLTDTLPVRRRFEEKIITHFESLIGQKLKNSIVTKRVLSIKNYQLLYNAYKGSALGLSHTLFQTALFRPQHKSKKIKNLYFTGQYTHPGIGVPMTFISSELVTNRIVKEHGD